MAPTSSPSAVRTPVARPSCTTTRSTSRPVSHEPPLSSISRTSASTRRAPPPRGIGMPPSCTATAITCVMKPEPAASGPRPVCSTQGASTPCARSEANVCVSQSRLEPSTFPANSTAPFRPSRRYARSPSLRPSRDQSSVPSTPNARSALGRKPSTTPAHSGPSSETFASVERSTKVASPSGVSVAVGCSVLRYSRPRAARSSPSSACAAPPTQSGCQALKTSCRYPGSVSSAVRMQPPSSSSRSSTRTFQPARASSAAQASELIPLPTTIASCSATCQLPELVVRHQTALARAELLHLRQHVGAEFVWHVEPELLGLDPDRVEPALLAEHDSALGADELRRVRLDRRRVVELARDGAALAAEERLACHRFPGLEHVAGELAHALGHLPRLVEAQVGLDAVERAQRQGDLREVRVAGPLAHAVDRPVHPARSCPDGCDRGGSGEAEVVVAVEVDGEVGPDPLDRAGDEVADGLRRGDPERVDDGDLLRPRLDRALVDLLVEVGLRSRRVHPEERGVDSVLGREAHRVRDASEHPLSCHADRLELQIRDRRLDHRGAHPELHEGLEVRGHRAREAPDLRAQAGVRDQLHGFPVVLRDAREAGLDAVDAELVEQTRDLELLLRVEHHPDRLLAVAH